MTKINYSELFLGEEVILKNEAGETGIFSVTLRGIFDQRPDCKVTSFYRNFWFRTNAGLKQKHYSSLEHLKKAVERKALHYGLTVVKWQAK